MRGGKWRMVREGEEIGEAEREEGRGDGGGGRIKDDTEVIDASLVSSLCLSPDSKCTSASIVTVACDLGVRAISLAVTMHPSVFLSSIGLTASKSSTSAWNSELVNLLSSLNCERGGFLDCFSAGGFLAFRTRLGEASTGGLVSGERAGC